MAENCQSIAMETVVISLCEMELFRTSQEQQMQQEEAAACWLHQYTENPTVRGFSTFI